ncbi:MAG: peptide chain release factor 2 [Desulfomonile tiedjei]|uniref:Peptide chain release factor 2 n=1 Tax=Desulfomonile tiedjei TaxID=2358 RepID=A0A9D6V2K4_9BACT|nr:peptide chain release factor 2 [Desulfomonile tiedjei]
MNSEVIFDLDAKISRLNELEKTQEDSEFWNNPEAARAILKEQKQISTLVERFLGLDKDLDDTSVLLELALEEDDRSVLKEVEDKLVSIEEHIRGLEIQRLFSRPEDAGYSIVEIHAGAGGTEAQDWAEMILRMYLRWAEREGFKSEILDMLPGEEAGVKSVTFSVEGEYAHGRLKAEIGIHRLVRISPFDANSRRHTSFAAVFVYPSADDDVDIQINEADLKVDTYRASGAGGQHVNKTDSAVRITHLPTGIVVQCQNERSQHKNRAMALKILKSRLYDLEIQRKQEEKESLHKSKKEIAWGSQIRSYVLQPYQMVKDHRTNCEIGNVSAVLDGDINRFIQEYLLVQASEAS